MVFQDILKMLPYHHENAVRYGLQLLMYIMLIIDGTCVRFQSFRAFCCLDIFNDACAASPDFSCSLDMGWSCFGTGLYGFSYSLAIN